MKREKKYQKSRMKRCGTKQKAERCKCQAKKLKKIENKKFIKSGK